MKESVKLILEHYRPTQDEIVAKRYSAAFGRAKIECRNRLLRLIDAVDLTTEQVFVNEMLADKTDTASFLTSEFVKRWFVPISETPSLPETDEASCRFNLDGKRIY
jgi:hypothetical protein